MGAGPVARGILVVLGLAPALAWYATPTDPLLAIAVAALAGSLFYAAVALIERIATFWHPSQRG